MSNKIIRKIRSVFVQYAFCRFFLVLTGVKRVIIAVFLQKFLMCTLFDDLARTHNQNQISMTDCGQTVRNQEGSSALQQLFDGILDELFRQRID